MEDGTVISDYAILMNMNYIHIKSSDGKSYQIRILGIEKHVNFYPPVWRTRPSPYDHPQTSDPYTAAGSVVGFPYQEGSLNDPAVKNVIKQIGTNVVAYLKPREDITYSCSVNRDIDESCHVGRDGNPAPHWNFLVKRTLSHDRMIKNENYRVEHNEATNVPKSDWIKVKLKINGQMLSGANMYFWDKESKLRYSQNTAN